MKKLILSLMVIAAVTACKKEGTIEKNSETTTADRKSVV